MTKNAEMEYTEGSDYQVGAGNSYSASRPLSPYRGMFGDGNNLNSQKDFEKYFKSTAERYCVHPRRIEYIFDFRLNLYQPNT